MPGKRNTYAPPVPMPQAKEKTGRTITIYKKKPPPGYVVKSGDTLSALARQWATTVKDIARINKIKDPNKIRVGDRLKKPPMNRMPPAAIDPRTGKPKVF